MFVSSCMHVMPVMAIIEIEICACLGAQLVRANTRMCGRGS